ncbi:MAG: hypothetical protein WC758_03055 [Candidatus Woesearchaeota archaeon]|jgi:hypothetical protein
MKFKKLNKKGFASEGDKMSFWTIIILPFVTLLVILLIFWAVGMKDIFVNKQIEPVVYESRLIYSGECFAFKDSSTERTYTGVIDSTKFTTEVLRECVPLSGASKHALAVELKTNQGQLVAFLESANWNMNVQSITTSTYLVEIKGNGPGIITFFHKEGK